MEHGTPKKKAQELWSLIEPFARYGFNKSHAVAYALVAYKTAYLKAHYPIDFFAANLSAEIGSTDGIVKVLGDCQESGIAVLPPDINESRKSFSAAGAAIRFGLAAIKGVGEAAARAILEERGKRPFASFSDFIERLDSRLVNKRTLDALIAAGALRLARPEPGDARRRRRARRSPARPAAGRRSSSASRTSSEARARAPTPGPRPTTFPDMPEWPLDQRLKGRRTRWAST